MLCCRRCHHFDRPVPYIDSTIQYIQPLIRSRSIFFSVSLAQIFVVLWSHFNGMYRRNSTNKNIFGIRNSISIDSKLSITFYWFLFLIFFSSSLLFVFTLVPSVDSRTDAWNWQFCCCCCCQIAAERIFMNGIGFWWKIGIGVLSSGANIAAGCITWWIRCK